MNNQKEEKQRRCGEKGSEEWRLPPSGLFAWILFQVDSHQPQTLMDSHTALCAWYA